MTAYERFWYGFGVSRVKLVLFRVAFFSMVGLDAFLQIEHAPRYGAGDFNVGHFGWLQWLLPSPTREGMLLVFLLQAYLAFRAAFGAATKTSIRLLAGLYAYAYFVSQLDSYQHHYLVFLLLVVCSFVPWDEPAPETSGETEPERPGRKDPKKDQKTRHRRSYAQYAGGEVKSWALRLIYVQLAIVYVWAAVSKMGAQWIDGATLARQIHEPWARDLIEDLFGAAYRDDPGGFGVAAKMVIMLELALPIMVLWRRLWIVALPVGVTFHLGVELAGLKIGLFSYLMCGVYVLMIPEWLLSFGAAHIGTPIARAIGAARAAVNRLASIPATFAALIVGGSVVMVLPYTVMWIFALAIVALGAIAVAVEYWRDRTVRSAHAVAAAHLAVCLVLVGLHYTTEQSYNYHKYWAGSARRLGSPEEQKAAYERLTELHPEYGAGHYHLGNIYLEEGKATRALESYTRATEHAPDDYRAFLGQAIIYAKVGDGAKAFAAAARALELEPNNARAQRIRDRFADQAPQSTIDAP